MKIRSYVTFSYNGKRFREYNGNRLGADLHPNRSATLKERSKVLNALKGEYDAAFRSGWNPDNIAVKPKSDF